jgi:hypothetical protein
MIYRDLHGNVLGQRFDGSVDPAIAARVREFYAELVLAHPPVGDTGRLHGPLLSPFGRSLTPARRAQGFVSQAHLDAVYAHLDHVRDCATCQTPGAPMPLDDGLQPTSAPCDVEQALMRASCAEHFADAEEVVAISHP